MMEHGTNFNFSLIKQINMKKIFLGILSLLLVASFVKAQDSTTVTGQEDIITIFKLPSGKGMFASIATNSIGIMSEESGLVIGIGEADDSLEAIVIGLPNEDDNSQDMPKGLMILSNGAVLINTDLLLYYYLFVHHEYNS